ncbi:54S ribosomal protein L4 mitochondrial [Coemansia spiralis]|nr:54S ribosomal protein L4 mitochondrial [Coemansia spiralis]
MAGTLGGAMLGRIGTAAQQLSVRRATQGGFVGRGLEEFFENGTRLPKKQGPAGRAWSASELRQKSWQDLQKLWYVVLKERNVLASQREERQRLGVVPQFFTNASRVIKCKKTMARIKTVLTERNIAWETAQKAAAASGRRAGGSAPTATPTPTPTQSAS